MCYERRFFTSDEHKMTSTVADARSERTPRHEEVIRNLLHDAPQPTEKREPAPAKEYIPAK
jgi:hypothetical protein